MPRRRQFAFTHLYGSDQIELDLHCIVMDGLPPTREDEGTPDQVHITEVYLADRRIVGILRPEVLDELQQIAEDYYGAKAQTIVFTTPSEDYYPSEEPLPYFPLGR